MIDICQACRCCNHCGTRHDGDQDEARCPLDPDVTQAEVEAMLRDAGITAEEQKRGLDSLMEMLNLYTENQRLTVERDELRTRVDRFAATIRDLMQYAPPLTAEELKRIVYDEDTVAPATTLSSSEGDSE